MRKLVLAAVVLAVAQRAAADDLSARALVGYEGYDTNGLLTSGFRQTYDLRLNRALTGNATGSVFFRGDDFNGTTGTVGLRQSSGYRQLQPGAEFNIESSNFLLLARTEYFDTRSRTGTANYSRNLERSNANLTWSPTGLPVFRVVTQRNRTYDAAADIHLAEDIALGSIGYEWHGVSVLGQENYNHASDPNVGYDRKSQYTSGNVGYTVQRADGKLAFSAETVAQFMHLDETGTGTTTTLVPTPVAIGRVLYAVDDTPLDSRDHPPVAFPLLTDGDLTASAGIALGPDGLSFQNLVLDIGRIDRVDEIRVIVRDAAGNPLRNGGGPVTWDAYSSEDGQVWTVVNSQTSYINTLSYYAITFAQSSGRWFKVVNFGVNTDVTLVTEVQAYYHTAIAAGQHRVGTLRTLGGNANLMAHPYDRFTFTYAGLFSSTRQTMEPLPETSTDDREHLAGAQYDVFRTVSVRGQYLRRDVKNFAGPADYANIYTGYLDWLPTKQLRVTLESSYTDQTLEGSAFTLDTNAIHVNAWVLRSMQMTVDAGTEKQFIESDFSTSYRHFANLTGNIQLTPRTRMLLLGSLQRTNTQSDDPAVELLGPEKDNRISSEFIWRAGRELMLSVRVGWVNGQELSGWTERYHVDWYPFADGTLSIGGSYDQDIDPMFDRKATRVIFNPRWMINRWATLDINYTSVDIAYQSTQNRQRSLYATLTLTK